MSFEQTDLPMADIAMADALAPTAADIIQPLMPLVAAESPDSPNETLNTLRQLGDLSVSSVFPLKEVSIEVSPAHSLSREDVIFRNARTKAVRIAQHRVRLLTLEARVRQAEATGDLSRLSADAL